MLASKVRVGRNSDGGYVLPTSALSECDLCVSYGLGHDTSFERWISSKGMKVIGFDPDVSAHPKWARSGRVETYSDFANLSEVASASSVLLKMDVEGSEYGFLNSLDLVHFADKVHTFALEIHTGNGLRPNWADIDVLEKVLRSHDVVHVHANNFGKSYGFFPNSLEVTFLSKKRMSSRVLDMGRYPSPVLDSPNNPNKPDYCMVWVNQVPLL